MFPVVGSGPRNDLPRILQRAGTALERDCSDCFVRHIDEACSARLGRTRGTSAG